MEWQQDLKDPTEFLETVKIDLFQRRGLRLHAQGRREGAAQGRDARSTSPTRSTREVGDHCSGARVNGMIVPLRYKLRNGDTVEILTRPNQQPTKDWLKFVVTSRARTKIRALHPHGAARAQPRSSAATCSSASCASASFSLATAEREGWLDAAAERAARSATPTSCWSRSATARSTWRSAADAVLIDQSRSRREDAPRRRRPRAARRRRCARSRGASGRSRASRSQGEADILVQFAKCCTPGARRPDRRLHHPRPRRHHPHPRLPEGARPRSRRGASTSSGTTNRRRSARSRSR